MNRRAIFHIPQKTPSSEGKSRCQIKASPVIRAADFLTRRMASKNLLKASPFLRLTSLVAAVSGFVAVPLRAQAPAAPAPASAPAVPTSPYPATAQDVEGLIKAANDGWNKADYKLAVGNFVGLLGKLIQTGTPADKLEELYFYIALCYFNIPDHPNAEKTFNEYLQKYPKGRDVSRAGLGLARVYAAQKKWPEAIAKYDKVRNDPALKELKDDIYIELANAYKENQNMDKAVSLLETALAPGVKSEADVRQALFLATLYKDIVSPGAKEKAVKLLDRVKGAPGARPMVAEVNYVALEIADALIGEGKAEEALAAYQNIRKQKEVVATMKEVVAVLDRQVANWKSRTSAAAGAAAGAKNAAAQQKAAMAQEMVSRFTAQADAAKKQLETIEKEKAYDAIVFYRIGRCFAQLERYWEANLAFEFVLDKFPAFEDKETVQFGQLFAFYKLTPPTGQPDGLKIGEQAEKLAKKFLADFPKSSQAQEVAAILVEIVQRRDDPNQTNKIFDDVMGLLPEGPQRSNFMAIQVQNYLNVFNFDKAREAADKYLQANPDGAEREIVDYMRALTWFFKNDYNGTKEVFKNFRETWKTSVYLVDLGYREQIIRLGEERQRKGKKEKTDFKSIVDACKAIAETASARAETAGSIGDAWALAGDALKDMPNAEVEDVYGDDGDQFIKRDRETCDAYLNAFKFGGSAEVKEYAMTTVRPMLSALDRWTDYESVHREFVRAYPDHRLYSECIKEVSKAIKRQAPELTEEEIDKAFKEAQATAGSRGLKASDISRERVKADLFSVRKEQQAEKVRDFMASEIEAMIDLPQKEGVEDLIAEFAINALPPKRKPQPAGAPVAAVATPPASTTGTGTPAKPAGPELYSVDERFAMASATIDKHLKGETLTDVARVRLEFAKIKLLEYLEMTAPKKRGPDNKVIVETGPKKSELLMAEFVQKEKAENLSSALLANVGDYLLQKGGAENKEKAASYYNRLLQFFPQSLFLDYGAVGLGQIALADEDYKTAYRRFSQAIDEFPGGKYGEAQLGKARCLVRFTSETDLADIKKTREEALTTVEDIVKEIIGDKSFPPETKAEAWYTTGVVKNELKDYAAAFNAFQRLYLSFGKFPSWMAKGYLEAGMAKEKAGKSPEALDVYQEAQTERISSKIKDTPEYKKLLERYKALSGGR